jgi:hypothetical protein
VRSWMHFGADEDEDDWEVGVVSVRRSSLRAFGQDDSVTASPRRDRCCGSADLNVMKSRYECARAVATGNGPCFHTSTQQTGRKSAF